MLEKFFMYEGWMVGVFLLKRLCVTRVRNFLYDVRYEIMVFGFFVIYEVKDVIVCWV